MTIFMTCAGILRYLKADLSILRCKLGEFKGLWTDLGYSRTATWASQVNQGKQALMFNSHLISLTESYIYYDEYSTI
jgi:hypothetical protein